MTDQPEALRLADRLEGRWALHPEMQQAAAELRRLHDQIERLAAEVANRNRRALEGDEAVSGLAKVHAHYEGIEAERDALLAELQIIGDLERRRHITQQSGLSEWADWVQNRARHAAINAAKGDK